MSDIGIEITRSSPRAWKFRTPAPNGDQLDGPMRLRIHPIVADDVHLGYVCVTHVLHVVKWILIVIVLAPNTVISVLMLQMFGPFH
jgi:hypothetical protein